MYADNKLKLLTLFTCYTLINTRIQHAKPLGFILYLYNNNEVRVKIKNYLDLHLN